MSRRQTIQRVNTSNRWKQLVHFEEYLQKTLGKTPDQKTKQNNKFRVLGTKENIHFKSIIFIYEEPDRKIYDFKNVLYIWFVAVYYIQKMELNWNVLIVWKE